MGCSLPKDQSCVTCGMNSKQCPGHPGHIELDVPVYHPLLFLHLFQLLRASCNFCHKLKLSPERCRRYLVRLKLYEMDEVLLADTLNDLENKTGVFDDPEDTAAKDFAEVLKGYEKRFEHFCRRQQGKSYTLSASAKRWQEQVIQVFQREAQYCTKCENCESVSPAYRKDGYSKIFRKAPSKRMQQQMKLKKRKMTSALATREEQDSTTEDDEDEEDKDGDDAHDDDDDDVFDATGKKQAKPTKKKVDDAKAALSNNDKQPDKFVAPSEVEAVIRALWVSHTELLEFIWGPPLRAASRIQPPQQDGYKVFFVKALLVPANRFRPEAHIGEQATECPQNVYLSRIIQGNDEIRRLESDTMHDDAQGEASTRDSDAESAGEEPLVGPAKSSQEKGSRPPKSYIAKLVQLWIALQDSVNCFMDSTKDPNPLNKKNNPPGIRQVLERKEGMFRMNMMGKRVNHCCRSVISPDPYLGMNEVGVPKHFAMTLVYPEPVNDFNAKHLRMLVERGADEYPGLSFLISSSFCIFLVLFWGIGRYKMPRSMIKTNITFQPFHNNNVDFPVVLRAKASPSSLQ